ncbi:hypothetical protein, partial [Sphingobacterium sp.]|uniref:hypothetical protein n=1 Tax=Sphingobacterium sp. TaxID=341027 RepID=UPI0028AB99FF
LNKFGFVVFRDSSFVRMTGRWKPKVKDLYANVTGEAILFLLFLNKFGFAVFRDSSFVRMTGRWKPKVKDLYANATREAILFSCF